MRYIFSVILILLSSSPSFGFPAVWCVPAQNSHFVGREAFLQQIQTLLKAHPICALVGGPGFGKSQLAKQFAYLNQGAYDIVWWFRADQLLSKSFIKFAAKLNKLLEPHEQLNVERLAPENLLENVKTILGHKPLRSLFIFDDVKDFEKIAPFLPDQGAHRHILMTARTKKTSYPVLTVDPFTKEESIALMRQLLPQVNSQDQMKLVDYFGNHPLALATAASFLLIYPSVGAQQYLSSHELQREELPPGLFVDQHEQNLETTLRITASALLKEHPEAYQILRFLTLLHNETIPLSYISSFLKKEGSSKSADSVVSTLYAHSLLDVQKNNHPDKVRLSMHELIQDLLYRQIPEAEKKKLIEKAIPVIAEPFEGRSDLMTTRILKTPEYLMHAQILSQVACELNYHSIPLFSLRIRMLDVVIGGLRDFEKAKKIIEDIKEDQKILSVYRGDVLELAGEPELLSPMDQAILEINLGYFEGVYSADYESAMRHEKKALEILEHLPDAHEEILRTVTLLAQSYIYKGDLKSAEPFIEKGKRHLKDSKAPLTNYFFMFGAWSDWLIFKGQYEDALNVMKDGERFLKDSDFPVYEIALFLQQALVLAQLGQHEKSIPMVQKAQTLITDFFGSKESNLLGAQKMIQAFNNVGSSMNLDESLVLIKEALGIFERAFHGAQKHVWQGLTYFILGQLYEQQKDCPKALEAYQKSEGVYDAVLKEKAIDDVSRLYSTISILGLKMKDWNLARTYMGKQMDVFDINHPGTTGIARYALRNKLKIPYPNSLDPF